VRGGARGRAGCRDSFSAGRRRASRQGGAGGRAVRDAVRCRYRRRTARAGAPHPRPRPPFPPPAGACRLPVAASGRTGRGGGRPGQTTARTGSQPAPAVGSAATGPSGTVRSRERAAQRENNAAARARAFARSRVHAWARVYSTSPCASFLCVYARARAWLPRRSGRARRPPSPSLRPSAPAAPWPGRVARASPGARKGFGTELHTLTKQLNIEAKIEKGSFIGRNRLNVLAIPARGQRGRAGHTSAAPAPQPRGPPGRPSRVALRRAANR
jgi:hypothetical protein